MKRILSIFIIFFILCGVLIFKRTSDDKKTIVIYTSTEDYNMELMQERLNAKFPNYTIAIEYFSTSSIASKVIEEGEKSECDIVYALDYGYLEKIANLNKLANLYGEYNMTIYEDNSNIELLKNYVIPTIKTGGGIIINNNVLRQRGIAKPTCYEDLLKPEFKGLISMPSPKSSGTGYIFYKSLVNVWGETKTLNYFKGFSENIYNNFTSSGSGPVNAIVQGEVAVGLGMISQAVEKIANGRTELEILTFDEGAPYGLYGTAVVKGKENKTEVWEVMDYLYSSYIDESCEKFYPESFIKNKTYNVAKFPTNIIYSDMSNNTLTEKERLLNLWSY